DVDAELFDVGDRHGASPFLRRPTLVRPVSLVPRFASLVPRLASLASSLASLGEQRDRRGVPVQEVVPPYGPELARAEHAGDGSVTEGLGDDRGVVVGL